MDAEIKQLRDEVLILQVKNEMLKTRNELLEMKLQEVLNVKLCESELKQMKVMHQNCTEVIQNDSSNSDTEDDDSAKDNSDTHIQPTEDSLSKISHMPRMPVPRIEKFDGHDNWESFITQFHCLAHNLGWSDSERLLQLLHHVKNDARQFVFLKCNSSTRESYRKLETALQKRFGSSESRTSFIQQLDNLSFTLGDSLAEYTTDIAYLVRKAWPNVKEETRSEMEVHHFLHNIDNPDLLRTVGMASPQNLQAARDIAETFIHVEESLQRNIGLHNVKLLSMHTENKSVMEPLVKEPKEHQLWNCLRMVTTLAKKLSFRKKKKSRNSKTNRRCYNCRCTGHYAHECAK